ncbi:uncharacterized protein K02A2.6-like [Octopus sinensis]|uniref:Uncharacterized protein K02A2.6-like n=1 Tax=Octopus sinensis TaxID=2607531 RepID=A0A6P7SNM1_9MOLL|nr:uncharacterized protein K02A2.6-like [Octopus sinensis]
MFKVSDNKYIEDCRDIPSYFGLKVASAVFQQIMDAMLSDCELAISYLDDILIKCNLREQNAEHVKAVFMKIKEYGFTLSEEKSEYFLPQIKYLGQITDKNGRRPDQSRAGAIDNMPALKNMPVLQAFLGLAYYYQTTLLTCTN